MNRVFRLMVIAGMAGVAALALRPYHDGALRFGMPLALLALWLGTLGWVWHRRWLCPVLLAVPALVAAPFLLPGRPIDPAALRTGYLASMEKMNGAPYVWGGESPRGIDCSGLPRRALRDALWEAGLATGNGAAFRGWASQWWFDTSAKALGENYRGVTRSTGIKGKLRDLDFTKLSAGDLAVTTDGRHVMVYQGDGAWIQADPGPLKVTLQKSAESSNPWFDAEVNMQRWVMLE